MTTLLKTHLLRPIKGEEWIEKKREHEFWIGEKRSYRQALYSRLTKSYFGWWCYFHLYSLGGRASLLIDPLSSGGLSAHLKCFLFNAIVVDVWWSLKHRLWRLFHRGEWKQQLRFMDAALQASREGYADPMPPPPGFESLQFHGSVLGERYFRRVSEILRDTEEKGS